MEDEWKLGDEDAVDDEKESCSKEQQRWCFFTPTQDWNAQHRIGISALEPRVDVRLPAESENCDFYFGNDQKVESGNAEAAAEILLMREFPELFEAGTDFAARFVPDCFISAFPKQLHYGTGSGIAKKAGTTEGNLKGEENERHFYEELQGFLRGKTDLIVLNGWENTWTDSHFEVDFIIISKRQCIKNLPIIDFGKNLGFNLNLFNKNNCLRFTI